MLAINNDSYKIQRQLTPLLAHLLAHQALDLWEDFLVWLEDSPLFITAVIHAELTQPNKSQLPFSLKKTPLKSCAGNQ